MNLTLGSAKVFKNGQFLKKLFRINGFRSEGKFHNRGNGTWRNSWAELKLTVKGSGEVITLPVHMAWQMAGDKVSG